jgi:hypothetical protein
MRRRPRTRSRILLAALAAALLAAPAPAGAAAPVTVGYDVSFPLCGAALPAGAAFGIVGVNAGLANNANPCLAAELAWAAATPGLASPLVPAVALYANTADPGPGVASWPTPANGGAAPATPFGPCDGSWSPACAYLYGAARAIYSYALAAASAGSVVAPGSAPWWLDVENESSLGGGQRSDPQGLRRRAARGRCRRADRVLLDVPPVA